MNAVSRQTVLANTLDQPLPELSFVIPAHNEQGCIGQTVSQVCAFSKKLGQTIEIIVVDDGSTDATCDEAQRSCEGQPAIILRLSRNFGKEQAIMAGLNRSTGRAVVVLDADLQEPLHYLKDMLVHRAEGYEMIYAVRAKRLDESWLKRVGTHVFYKLLNFGTEMPIPQDARDFRLMDRRVVDALCALPERNRFMKGLYGWVGFRSVAVPIEIAPRHSGCSKFGFKRLTKLALTGLTAFTEWPLRVWTGIGMIVAVSSLLFGFWIVLRTLLFGIDVPGWSTLVVAVSLLGGVQLISIGVLGEYLARVFSEVKGRPGYIVAEEHVIRGDR